MNELRVTWMKEEKSPMRVGSVRWLIGANVGEKESKASLDPFVGQNWL